MEHWKHHSTEMRMPNLFYAIACKHSNLPIAAITPSYPFTLQEAPKQDVPSTVAVIDGREVTEFSSAK